MEWRERLADRMSSASKKLDVRELLLNVVEDVKEQYIPAPACANEIDIDIWYLMVRLTYGIGAYKSKAKKLEEFAKINYNVDFDQFII